MNKFLFLLVMLFGPLVSCKKDLPLGENELKPCMENLHPKMEKAVMLVLGQSNAANAGETRYYAACENLKNFYNGEFFPLKDPLKGSNGVGGSVWTRMAEQLMENNFANEIIIAPAAVGGSAIEAWVPGGALNPLMTSAVNSLQTEGLQITHVLWHQGESNNAMLPQVIDPEINALVYQENFLIITQQLRQLGVKAPIFIATATRCGHLLVDPVLQEAQQELAYEDFGIFHGPNTDLLGMEYRYDGCHFNDEGLKLHALRWTEILLQH